MLINKDNVLEVPRTKNNLATLVPNMQWRVEEVLFELVEKGWQPVIAEGRRTVAEQREKVKLGYSKTMNSRHLSGRAADIIDQRYSWGPEASKKGFKFWTDLRDAAYRQGLVWGGVWKSKSFGPNGDAAHVELESYESNEVKE